MSHKEPRLYLDLELQIAIRRLEGYIDNLKSTSPKKLIKAKKLKQSTCQEKLVKALTELIETKARLKTNIKATRKKNEEIIQILYLASFSLVSLGLGIFVGVYWF